MTDRALQGIRVLSMEQAAALPFATRHLADLGAEVIRVQSHKRAGGPVLDASLFRNKRMLGLDLSHTSGPAIFRRVAAISDVVLHNFTPRVMRKYAIDFPNIKAINSDVVYGAITGFGSTGPWADRPLFGPGAEALSGQNLLIGDPKAWTPGRPGTITYADNICGLNLLFAILAALELRDATGEGASIDVSLYETGVSQIGTAITDHAFGGPLPQRMANLDLGFSLHAVFDTRKSDQTIAIALRSGQESLLLKTLRIKRISDLEAFLLKREAGGVAIRLQSVGIAASRVQDPSDIASDDHLRARDYFGSMTPNSTPPDDMLQFGPAWGNAKGLPMSEPHHIGADNRKILQDAGYSHEAIEQLYDQGAIGEVSSVMRIRESNARMQIERGEISRVDINPGSRS